jgi:hypothetical protein
MDCSSFWATFSQTHLVTLNQAGSVPTVFPTFFKKSGRTKPLTENFRILKNPLSLQGRNIYFRKSIYKFIAIRLEGTAFSAVSPVDIFTNVESSH